MKVSVVAYVPVIHRGYLDFFDRNVRNKETIFILGEEFIQELMPLHEEIRALDPKTARNILSVLKGGIVFVLDKEKLHLFPGSKVVLPNEEISRKFAEKYLRESEVQFDDVFLRWDEKSVLSHNSASDRISHDDFDREMIRLAQGEADKSSDWWRHVGAIAVKDGAVLLKTHNHHVPSEHMPYIFGDPRDHIKAGERSELSTALHGEQSLIVDAAREGISLKGAHLYVTTRPCPVCSKLIAYSGISKCFFLSGHASLDSDSVLHSQGVEIIQVV